MERYRAEDEAVADGRELFDLEETIGRGAYGSVHRATHKKSGQVIALKVGFSYYLISYPS
jgi:serine/threonine protein kinase